MIIKEKLENIKSSDSKWYDLINLTLRKMYKEEMIKVFEKNFKVNHSLIDNSKTKIYVSLPLIGWNYYIVINLYDKQGKDIIDYNHEGNTFSEPLTIQIKKDGNKWDPYYHTLFLKEKYQNQKLGSEIVKILNKCIKILQNTREIFYQGTDLGRYVISRMPGCKFRESSQFKDIKDGYIAWCKKHNVKCLTIPTQPKDFPKEFLTSTYAPEIIDYNVPIR